jgi:hypothetical protein
MAEVSQSGSGGPDWVVHVLARGMEEGAVVYRGVRYWRWRHLHNGVVYWLVYGPRGMSLDAAGGTPSGLAVAPAEFQHLRP